MVVGSLLLLAALAEPFFAEWDVPIEAVAHLPYELWVPEICPLCQNRMPLEDPGHVAPWPYGCCSLVRDRHTVDGMSNDPILAKLSALVGKAVGEKAFAETLERVQRSLQARPAAPQAWEPVPLDVFGADVPESIQSCWVFVLRGDGVFGAERHPNSHQRTIALGGAARFEVYDHGAWSPRPVDARGVEPSGDTSISIPPNTWHRIAIGPETFVSCSFHTVPARELIEETPVGDDLAVTQQRLYHEEPS